MIEKSKYDGIILKKEFKDFNLLLFKLQNGNVM